MTTPMGSVNCKQCNTRMRVDHNDPKVHAMPFTVMCQNKDKHHGLVRWTEITFYTLTTRTA